MAERSFSFPSEYVSILNILASINIFTLIIIYLIISNSEVKFKEVKQLSTNYCQKLWLVISKFWEVRLYQGNICGSDIWPSPGISNKGLQLKKIVLIAKVMVMGRFKVTSRCNMFHLVVSGVNNDDSSHWKIN